MGRTVIPRRLLFALGLLSTDGWGQIFPKGTHADEYYEELCFQYPSPITSHIHPCFPSRTSKTAVRFDPDSNGDFAFPWDPVHVKVCVHLLIMGSPFPPVPWSSCAQVPLALNARCSRGSFSKCQSFTWGSELSLL